MIEGDIGENALLPGQGIRSTKLRIMTPSQFAPGWVSDITGTSRGFIHENWDEYPTRTQPMSLADLGNRFTSDRLNALDQKNRKAVEEATEYQRSLMIFNAMAAGGGTLGTIADAVTAFRTGYGMLMTATNLIADPFGTLAQAAGISPQQLGSTFNAIGQAAQGNFEPLANGLVSYVPGVSSFLGASSRNTWANWGDRVASQDVESLFLQGEPWKGKADLGEVYKTQPYKSSGAAAAELNKGVAAEAGYDTTYNAADFVNAGGGEADYDSAYGENDYTSLLDAEERKDEQAAADASDLPDTGTFGGETSSVEPNAGKVEDSIDEAYGNTDDASFGENRDDPSTLEEVYGGEGTIKTTTPTAEERAAMLAAVYGVTSTQSEDVAGITTSGDDDAPINPVV